MYRERRQRLHPAGVPRAPSVLQRVATLHFQGCHFARAGKKQESRRAAVTHNFRQRRHTRNVLAPAIELLTRQAIVPHDFVTQ